MTYATLAFQHGTSDEQADAKKTWKEVALQFFADAAKQSKSPKLHRTKAFEWLCSTNYMLLVCTGFSWDRFIIPANCTKPALSWPSCTVTVDQGSDGWSSLHYLRSSDGVKRNLLLLHDESHRLWNDTQLSLADAKLYPHVLSCLVVLNLDHGPWLSQRWYQTMVEALHDLTNLTDYQDPLFQMLVQHMRQEMCSFEGKDSMQLQDSDIWASLAGVLSKKTDRVGLTRWFGYFFSMERFLAWRSRRLYIVLYICLSLGLFSKQKLAELSKYHQAAPTAVGEDIPKSTTGQDRAEVQRLRSSCKNSMSFSALVLSNHSLWRMNAILVAIAKPVREYHSQQNAMNRSGPESLQHWIFLSEGGGLEHVDLVRQKMEDPDLFRHLGIHSWQDEFNESMLKLEADDPIVEQETDLVEQMATFSVLPSVACHHPTLTLYASPMLTRSLSSVTSSGWLRAAVKKKMCHWPCQVAKFRSALEWVSLW